MKIKEMAKGDKTAKIMLFAVLFILAIYVILRMLYFESDPIIPFLKSLTEPYYLFLESLAAKILSITGSSIELHNHIVSSEGIMLDTINGGILLRKFFLFLLVVFWITPAKPKKKILFSLILVAAHILIIPVDISIAAELIARGLPNMSVTRLSNFPGNIILSALLFLWTAINKQSISEKVSAYFEGFSFNQIFRKFLIGTSLYILGSNLILGYFDFNPWIQFLFQSTHKILAIFNIHSRLEPNMLIGDNGSMYMAKGCLGFGTLLLFALVVYFTGRNDYRRWMYIIGGILFLNVVNIIRFALLFIHIQKHGTYKLSIDLHDMYNYIIYALVFILWIIWFEKFSDLRRNPSS